MMRVVKSCLQTLLKIMNWVMGIVGISMILYGLWMVRVWYRDAEGEPSFNSTAPWFIYAFLGLGVLLCLITCIGYVAADSGNSCCLSCYMAIIFLLILFETTLTADILLNSDWEKDLPEDPTGRFADFEDFVKSNFDICKWIGLLIALAQGLSILLSMVLRSIIVNYGSDVDTDREDNDSLEKLPLLSQLPPPPRYAMKAPPLLK